MPRVEHHQLRAHSTRSFAGRSLYLRQEDGSPVQFPHIPIPPPGQDIEARGLIGDVFGVVTTAVKSLTDFLGLTGNDPMPPPPGGGGGGGGGSSSSTSPGSTTGNAGSSPSTQGPSSSSSPANPTSGNPGNGNTNPGTGTENGNGNGNGNNGGGNGNGNGNGNGGNGNGNNPPSSETTGNGTPSTSSDSSPPSSTTPSNSGSPPANQDTPPGDVNEGPPGGSSGTPDASDSSGDSHYQGGPNLPGDAADASSDAATSIGGVVNAANGLLTGNGNGSSTGTGAIASTTDANGNVVPVSPTSTASPRNPNAASSSARIGIAIGVTLAILAVLAALFVLRKRRIAKRKDRRQRWWSSRRSRGLAESTEYYGDEKADLPPSPSKHAISPSNTPKLPSSPFVSVFPAPPPLAEVRKSANLIDHPVSSPSASPEARPLSTGSLISFASSNGSNGLPPMSFTTVTLTEESGTTGQAYHRFSSPPPSSDEHFLSFRHVSPPPSSDDHFQSFHHSHTSPPPSSDEHFAFPTPRVPAQAAIDRTSAYFQPRSPTLSRSSSTISGSTSRSSSTGGFASAPRVLNIQISSSTGHGHERDSNPFADPTAYDISDLPQQPHYPDNRTSFATDKDGSLRYSLTNSVASDPFSSGCGSLIASSCYNNFEEFEKVHVSFIGNLSDELSLRRGDEVRVLKIFEDGWALVVRNIQDGAEDAERGVIPVVCLSERLAGGKEVVRPERADSYTMSAFIG